MKDVNRKVVRSGDLQQIMRGRERWGSDTFSLLPLALVCTSLSSGIVLKCQKIVL